MFVVLLTHHVATLNNCRTISKLVFGCIANCFLARMFLNLRIYSIIFLVLNVVRGCSNCARFLLLECNNYQHLTGNRYHQENTGETQVSVLTISHELLTACILGYWPQTLLWFKRAWIHRSISARIRSSCLILPLLKLLLLLLRCFCSTGRTCVCSKSVLLCICSIVVRVVAMTLCCM